MCIKANPHVRLTWALGPSNGTGWIAVTNIKAANQILEQTSAIFKRIDPSSIIRCSAKTGKRDAVEEDKTKTVKRGNIWVFDESGPAKAKYVIVIKNLAPSVEEETILDILHEHNILGATCDIARTVQQDDTALTVQMADITALIPFINTEYPPNIVTLPNRNGRATIHLVYRDIPTTQQAVLQFAAEHHERFGQKIRFLPSYTQQFSVHEALWETNKNRLTALKTEYGKNGEVEIVFKTGTTVRGNKEVPKALFLFKSRTLSKVEEIQRKVRTLLLSQLFEHPEKHKLFSKYGRTCMQNIQRKSQGVAIHWEPEWHTIRLYGDAEAPSVIQAKKDLEELCVRLGELQLDVRLKLHPKKIEKLPPLENLRKIPEIVDVVRQGKTLIVSGSERGIEDIKEQLSDMLFKKHVQKSHAPKEGDCPLCMDELDQDNVELQLCGHRFCKDCIEQIGGTFPAVCPAENCGVELAWRDILTVVPEQIGPFKEKAVEDYCLNHANKYRHCPGLGCNQIINLASVEPHRRWPCDQCEVEYCLECCEKADSPIVAHPGMDCKTKQLSLNPDVVTLVNQVVENALTLKCPRCKLAYIDHSGCAAVQCNNCPCNFCAFCFADCGSDAHPHVQRDCKRNPKPGDYFATEDSFKHVQAMLMRERCGAFEVPRPEPSGECFGCDANQYLARSQDYHR
eukprot:c20485_g1_i4.p1 GENE.c20485_g1_i4~~c20485_g1_i4.p1  ORF type:complete len:682 (+),score=124.20 c20485_g1_i4:797-2842(+)